MTIYDELGEAYDQMIDWDRRLARDLPVIRRLLDDADARTVVDAACGTGALAAALHGAGYTATGVDLSMAMVTAARTRHPGPDYRQGDLLRLDAALDAPVDAVLILGNALAYLLTGDDLAVCAAACARCLRPGGVLLAQVRRIAPTVTTVLPGRDLPQGRLDRHLIPLDGHRYRLEIHRHHDDHEDLVTADDLRAWSAAELHARFVAAGFDLRLTSDLAGVQDVAVGADVVIHGRCR